MNSYQSKYLAEMTNTVCRIMNKDKLSEQDIRFIVFYRNELKRSEFKPVFDKILDCFNKVKQVINTSSESNQKEVKQDGELL